MRMAIFVDNEPLTGDALGQDATVLAVVDRVRAGIAGTGRMVLGLRCDEQDVSMDRLEQVLGMPCAAVGRLDVLTGSPGALVADALGVTRGALTETYATVATAASHLSSGDTADAMRELADCCAVWARVHEAVVRACGLLSLDVSGVAIEGRAVSQWLRDLAKTLLGIKTAIESRDTVLLGDILRYEMDQTLGDWERMLDGLIEIASSPLPAAGG